MSHFTIDQPKKHLQRIQYRIKLSVDPFQI